MQNQRTTEFMLQRRVFWIEKEKYFSFIGNLYYQRNVFKAQIDFTQVSIVKNNYLLWIVVSKLIV